MVVELKIHVYAAVADSRGGGGGGGGGGGFWELQPPPPSPCRISQAHILT
jgi:hypothetical protein